ncbi:MAG: hypothetical protein QM666_01475 [Acinetobacter sp.]
MTKIILLDARESLPTAKEFKQLFTRYETAYLFHMHDQLNYPLLDMTEFASWISSGQIVILDVPPLNQAELEYAILAGQLLSIIEPETTVDVLSTQSSISHLLDILDSIEVQVCYLTELPQEELEVIQSSNDVVSADTVQQPLPHALLQSVFQGDAEAFMTLLKQQNIHAHVETIPIDQLQWQVIQELHQLPEKPQHLLEFKQLLQRIFPEMDVQVLLKVWIDQGVLHWDGERLYYGAEFALN